MIRDDRLDKREVVALLYFCCVLIKMHSVTSAIVIKAPTNVKELNPYTNGKREITAVIIERTNIELKTPFFFNEINDSNKITTVSTAVISGAKFA